METQKQPTLEQIISYLNSNKHLLEREYNKFSVEKLMLMLDHPKLKSLEHQFKNYPTGLQLPSFLFVMQQILSDQCQNQQKFQLFDGLIKLFHCIDVNGDGHMMWQQFTQYIIEAIHKISKPVSSNKNYLQKQVIQSAYSKLGKEYKYSGGFDLSLQSYVRKMVWVNEINTYLCLEKNSCIIRLFDSTFKPKEQITISADKNYHYILDFDFDPDNLTLGILLPTRVTMYNFKCTKPKHRVYKDCPIPNLQNCSRFWYLCRHKYWALGTSEGQLSFYSIRFRGRSNIELVHIHTVKQHSDSITCLQEVQEPDMISSCSLDGKIKLLSMNTLRTLQFDDFPQHKLSVIDSKLKKGYLGFDYDGEFGNYALAFGFSNNVYIYNLDISLTKGYAGKYSQHMAPLISAKFIKGYPYVVSIDEKCCVRIWNFRTFKTNQVINSEKIFSNNCYMLMVPELNSFLACDKKINQFTSESFYKKSKQINQFHKLIDFSYNPYVNALYLFTSNDIRQYDMLTGRLTQVITNLSDPKYEFIITAGQFGPKCRKIYVGDAAGYLREYQSETGEYLCDLKMGQQDSSSNVSKQIVKILFVKESDFVISASVDGRVLVFYRNDSNEYHLIRDIRSSHVSDLTCMAYNHWFSLLATGCETGTVNVWNTDKYVLQTVYMVSQSKIVDISFVKNYPVLMVASEIGQIHCYSLKEDKRCLFKILNLVNNIRANITCFYLETKAKSIQISLNNPLNKQMQQQSSHILLAVGNSNGFVSTYCLDVVFKQYGVVASEQQYHEQIPTSKVRYDYIIADKMIQTYITKHTTSESSKKPISVINNSQILIRTFEAHAGSSVHKVKIIKEPFLLMSSGAEQKFKLWELEGQECGVINCQTFKTTFWRLPELNLQRKLKQLDFVIYCLKLIGDVEQVEPHQIETIKVRMLLSKYFNADHYKRLVDQIRKPSEKRKDQEQDTIYDIKCDVTKQFEDDYSSLVKKLQQQLHILDKQQNRVSVEFDEVKANPYNIINQKKKLVKSKEIRVLEAKLEAIQLGCKDYDVPRKSILKKRNTQKIIKEKVKSKNHNLIYISYDQLKKNMNAASKMIRNNEIR